MQRKRRKTKLGDDATSSQTNSTGTTGPSREMIEVRPTAERVTTTCGSEMKTTREVAGARRREIDRIGSDRNQPPPHPAILVGELFELLLCCAVQRPHQLALLAAALPCSRERFEP
jgi:hypothetical protein